MAESWLAVVPRAVCRMMSELPSCERVSPGRPGDEHLFSGLLGQVADGWVEAGPRRTLLPERYERLARQIDDFEVRDSDIFICSYPRSGNTWTVETVWLLANDCDFEGARRLITSRHAYLEGSVIVPEDILGDLMKYDTHISLEHTSRMQDCPRIIKTHLPWELLPRKLRDGSVKPKILWVSRDPRDVSVSLYHLFTRIFGISLTIEQCFEIFLRGRVVYGHYWDHFRSYWERRQQPNVLALRFEEMKGDLRSALRRVSAFLGRPIQDHFLDDAVAHLSFESMRFNSFCNFEITLDVMNELLRRKFSRDDQPWPEIKTRFIRKGRVGSHKEEMSAATIAKFEQWMAENSQTSRINVQ